MSPDSAGTIGRLLLASVALLAVPSVEAAADPAAQQGTAGDGGPIPPPPPRYDVQLQKSLMVEMRDGVRLSTDLYFPESAGDELPVILIRTGYNKNAFRAGRSAPWVFAGQGYAVAVQDVRGVYESEGQYTVYTHATEDGYDTIDWLVAQPWSTGKVGSYGCSYLGDMQMLMARGRNPHHAAMIPQASGATVASLPGRYPGRYRGNGVYNGGAVELFWLGWFRESNSKVYYQPPEGIDRSEWYASEAARYFSPAPALPEVDYREIFQTLPLIDMLKVSGGPPTDWEAYVSRQPADPWFDEFILRTDDRFDVPALLVNSWYDYGAADVLHQFGLLRRNSESDAARDNQFVIMSPSLHCGSESLTAKTVIGERELGDPRMDLWRIYLDWFDRWLKDVENDVTEMPHVQYYLMGKNEWHGADEWPLPETRFEKFYLHSDGHANSRFGTGVLTAMPPKDEPPDRFVYDPAAPVPTVGGTFCCTLTPGLNGGGYDQSEVEARHDVLVYTTPVLLEGIEITGPIEVVLYVSSSARDTDFVAKLVDVYPDGTAYNVQEGILRARYREGFDKKVWFVPGETYEVRIDLHATSNYFAAGHRIRLQITSSNFPRWDRNLNTGGNNYDETEWVVAENTLHHSGNHASYVLLPVIPER